MSVNEAAQWDWVRTVLLPSRPADHYIVTTLDPVELPDAMHDGRRTDTVNRDVVGPRRYPSSYEQDRGAPGATIDGGDATGDLGASWRERYLAGPPRRP